jgi:hypothetical protein
MIADSTVLLGIVIPSRDPAPGAPRLGGGPSRLQHSRGFLIAEKQPQQVSSPSDVISHDA